MPKRKIEEQNGNESAEQAFLRGVAQLRQEKYKGESLLAPLDEALEQQVLESSLAWLRTNERRKRNKRENAVQEAVWLYYLIHQYTATRNQRVEEMNSAEIQQKVAIVERIFPLGRPFQKYCSDGRLPPKLVSALDRRAYRALAGETNDWTPDEDDNLVLPPDSLLYKKIVTALQASDKGIVEVMDTHLGCAACQLKEQHRRHTDKPIPDSGLYAGIQRKVAHARALKKLAAEIGDKPILPILTSFDPKTGYQYMGLELCLDDTEAQRDGFTKEVIDRLVRENKILFSKQLLTLPIQDPESGKSVHLQQVFAQYSSDFELNYEQAYQKSSLLIWQRIEAMAPHVLPEIEKEVRRIFGDASEDEVRTRSLLLLANAFNNYLIRRANGGRYPHTEHQEVLMVLDDDDMSPFAHTKSMMINPADKDPYSAIHVAIEEVVRPNRDKLTFTDRTRHALDVVFGDQEDERNKSHAVHAPVPVIQFVRLARVDAKTRAILRELKLPFLLNPQWLTATDEQLKVAIRRATDSQLPGEIEDALIALLNRARDFYASDIGEDIFNGDIAPDLIMAGPDREILWHLPVAEIGIPQLKK